MGRYLVADCRNEKERISIRTQADTGKRSSLTSLLQSMSVGESFLPTDRVSSEASTSSSQPPGNAFMSHGSNTGYNYAGLYLEASDMLSMEAGSG